MLTRLGRTWDRRWTPRSSQTWTTLSPSSSSSPTGPIHPKPYLPVPKQYPLRYLLSPGTAALVLLCYHTTGSPYCRPSMDTAVLPYYDTTVRRWRYRGARASTGSTSRSSSPTASPAPGPTASTATPA
eukprot:3165228-Rhodomonas_salina.1